MTCPQTYAKQSTERRGHCNSDFAEMPLICDPLYSLTKDVGVRSAADYNPITCLSSLFSSSTKQKSDVTSLIIRLHQFVLALFGWMEYIASLI